MTFLVIFINRTIRHTIHVINKQINRLFGIAIVLVLKVGFRDPQGLIRHSQLLCDFLYSFSFFLIFVALLEITIYQ